jgi:integrase
MSLKANQVAAAIAAGVDRKIPDGNNLYLVVKNGRGFWVVQYRDGPKIRSKGLGSAANLSPAQARRAREDFVVRRRSENKSAADIASTYAPKGPASAPVFFGDAVEEFIIHRARVKNWKGGVSGAEADSYRRTLMRTSIAKVPLASITTANVLAVLTTMPAVTAEKTRTRIACVLDWAKAMGYRESAENVARRRGHMEYLLGTAPKARHHAALPWAEVPLLMRDLQLHDSPASRALRWTILTAARASETLGATRSEIKSPNEFARLARLPAHLAQGETWVIPAERMKEAKEHCVPLSEEALALIAGRKGKLFPGHERQMLDLICELRPGYTVHGFRSSFADWAAEHDYPQELREMALAHSVGDSVERAYRHSTRLTRRREMMIAWSKFVFAPMSVVAPTRRLIAGANS